MKSECLQPSLTTEIKRRLRSNPSPPSPGLDEPRDNRRSGLHAQHLAELGLIWAADKRMPTLSSRRAWATARGVDTAAVNNWFQRIRYNFGTRRGVRLPGGTYDLPVAVSGDAGTSLAVKRERVFSPAIVSTRKPKAGPLASDVPVRHTRAHEKRSNPQCPTCTQRSSLLPSETARSSLDHGSAHVEVDIKRERATSPSLVAKKTRKTRAAVSRAIAVKRERAVSPDIVSERPAKTRKLNQLKAYNTRNKALSEKTAVARILIRHTRAHDTYPNPDCHICSQKYFAYISSNHCAPSGSRSHADIPSPTPGPSSGVPSSDFDYNPRLSTPATSENGAETPKVEAPTSHSESGSRIHSDVPQEFSFWPGLCDNNEEPVSDQPPPKQGKTDVNSSNSSAYTQVSRLKTRVSVDSVPPTPAHPAKVTNPMTSVSSAALDTGFTTANIPGVSDRPDLPYTLPPRHKRKRYPFTPGTESTSTAALQERHASPVIPCVPPALPPGSDHMPSLPRYPPVLPPRYTRKRNLKLSDDPRVSSGTSSNAPNHNLATDAGNAKTSRLLSSAERDPGLNLSSDSTESEPSPAAVPVVGEPLENPSALHPPLSLETPAVTCDVFPPNTNSHGYPQNALELLAEVSASFSSASTSLLARNLLDTSRGETLATNHDVGGTSSEEKDAAGSPSRTPPISSIDDCKTTTEPDASTQSRRPLSAPTPLPTDLPPPDRPPDVTSSRPSTPERPLKPIRPAAESNASLPQDGIIVRTQIDEEDRVKECWDGGVTQLVNSAAGLRLEDNQPGPGNVSRRGAVLSRRNTKENIPPVDRVGTSKSVNAVKSEVLKAIVSAEHTIPAPSAKAITSQTQPLAMKREPTTTEGIANAKTKIRKLKPIPISSRTKRALGRPGKSFKILTPGGRKASSLLSVLVTLQARSRVTAAFNMLGNKTKKRQSKGDAGVVEVEVDRRFFSGMHVGKFQPPRTSIYDVLGLQAFNKVNWVSKRLHAPVCGSTCDAQDLCWELSAIPWLAAIGNGVVSSNPMFSLPERILISRDTDTSSITAPLVIPTLTDAINELYTPLHSDLKVPDDVLDWVMGSEGMLDTDVESLPKSQVVA